MLSGVRAAFFVACSWTWCIGMFLPVLLIRDFGGWAWVAFAVPNVIGAMCVGLVLSAEGARRMLSEHRRMVGAFIVWTVAFHAYFLAYWLGQYSMAREGARFLWLVVIGLALAMVGRGWRTMGWVAVAVWVASMAIFGVMEWVGDGVFFGVPSSGGVEAPVGMVGLVPALALGFLACPFLDASLLRARAETAGRIGAGAFVIGFGVLFLVLIGMTALYARMFAPGEQFSHWIFLYFALQGWFTVGALGREGREMVLGRGWWVAMGGLVLAAGVSGALVADRWFEFGYEVMLSGYALVFPAYVWTVVLGWGLPMRARVVGWLVTVGVASPFFVAGALFGRWVMLVPGVLIVLLGVVVGRVLAVRWGRNVGASVG